MRPSKVPSLSAGTARSLAILVALTALVFSPVLFADFIRLDDHSHLFNNPHLHRRSWAGLVEIWSKPYFNLYIPLTYSAWWVLTMVGGLTRQSAWLFHALNLALHLVNAALVFLLVRTLVRRDDEPSSPGTDRIPLLAALVFALHPMQVESVAWVSECKGVLSMSFGLLGLLWHCRSDRRVVPGVFFLAAMLAKPSAIVFPGVAFLLDRVVLGKSLRQSALLPALYGALLLPFVLWTKALQPDLNLDFVPTLGQRLLVAADAFAFYLRKTLLPYPLVVDYGRSPAFVLGQVPGWQRGLSALVLLAGVALLGKAVLRPPKSPEPSTESLGQSLILGGWSIFLLSLAPVLGLVPFGFQQFSTVADHYLYVPMVGACLMVAGTLVRLRGLVQAPRVALAFALVLAGLSFVQARHWRSTESLFTHTLQSNPQSYLGAFSIGDEVLRGEENPVRSLSWFEKSLAINPTYLEAQISLGMALVQSGDRNGAIEHYQTAIAKNPNSLGTRARSVASLHNNLGTLLMQVGRKDEAAAHFRTAVQLFPRSLNAHLNLGNLAMAQQRYGEAIAEYEKARELNPDNPGIQNRLGLARKLEEARREPAAESSAPSFP